jgi:predicted nuclease with TOPRIM domain
MRLIVRSSNGAHNEADALVAELSRLQGEVREVGQQLDRLEAEMWQALNDVANDRFEEYR